MKNIVEDRIRTDVEDCPLAVRKQKVQPLGASGGAPHLLPGFLGVEIIDHEFVPMTLETRSLEAEKFHAGGQALGRGDDARVHRDRDGFFHLSAEKHRPRPGLLGHDEGVTRDARKSRQHIFSPQKRQYQAPDIDGGKGQRASAEEFGISASSSEGVERLSECVGVLGVAGEFKEFFGGRAGQGRQFGAEEGGERFVAVFRIGE